MFASARKTILGLVLVASLVFGVSATQAAPSGGCVVGATTTCTFIYTGAPEAWVVPAGVTSAVFDLFGAQGGNFAPLNNFPGGAGGKGGHVQATVALTPGATLNMRVGGKGSDSVAFIGPFTVVGGFNGGGSITNDPGAGGNCATAAKSVTFMSALNICLGGGAGTLLGPGAAGSGFGCISGSPGAAGGLDGGDGSLFGVGAGGGGFFGGGAGAVGFDFYHASGGGGGSDYVDPSATNVTVTDGVQSGNGLITLTYATPSAVTFASANASRTAKGVLLRWRTGTEVDLLGFRVSRSLIAAKGSVSGASYRFLDKTARRAVPYRYRIKAVNRDGTASWFGPVRVT